MSWLEALGTVALFAAVIAIGAAIGAWIGSVVGYGTIGAVVGGSVFAFAWVCFGAYLASGEP